MFREFVCAVLLAALVSPSQEHAVGNATCELQFQEHIKAAIAVKRKCEKAVFDNCYQIKTLFSKADTGVYEVTKACKQTYSPFVTQTDYSYAHARCDMDHGNGGWLVIQRRVKNGTVDFYRGWSDYEEGFGDLEGEFWYGLKNIHCLTNRESVELRLDLEDEEGNKVTRTYQEFRVEGPENKYRLHIGGGDTPAGATDFMAQHNNMYFSTKDRDSDVWSHNCATLMKGGWWWGYCGLTNPNGLHSSSTIHVQLRVSVFAGSWVYYPKYEMKIRPKPCTSQASACS